MKNTMEKEDEKIVYGLLTLVVFPFIAISSIWTTYIIWDICTLFNLTYLTQCGYEVFFGTVFVLGMLTAKIKSDSKIKTNKEVFTSLIGGQVGYLFVWGIAYLLHWILRF